MGKENLAWAPNRVKWKHSIEELIKVVEKLRLVDEYGGEYEEIVDTLYDLGKKQRLGNRKSVKERYLKGKRYINNDKDILEIETVFGTWLHVASRYGKYEIVKYLIEMRMDLNNKGGISEAEAIYDVAGEGWYYIVKYLIECGAKLNIEESDKNPLFPAIYGSHVDIVKLLIDKGIDISIKYSGENMKNMDVYNFAIERGELEIAKLIENKMIEQNSPVINIFKYFRL